MAITTFATLKTAIASWLERSDLTSPIADFVSLAEDRIGLDLRVRAMETSSDITVNAQTEALPTGFLGLRRAYLDTDGQRIDYFPPAQFWLLAESRETGKPGAFTIEGENFVFAPYPSSGSYTFKVHYWKKFTALSGDSDTNWLLTNARGLLLYGSLLEAALYLEDDAAATKWGLLYRDLLDRVNKSDRKDRFPVGAVMRSEVAKV